MKIDYRIVERETGKLSKIRSIKCIKTPSDRDLSTFPFNTFAQSIRQKIASIEHCSPDDVVLGNL